MNDLLEPMFPGVVVALDPAEDALVTIDRVATGLQRAGRGDASDAFLRLAYETQDDLELRTLIDCTVTVL